MKIINSQVRHIAPDVASSNDPRTRGLAWRHKAVAQAKKIAHKRERAMMRQLASKELLQEHLVTIAEKREAARCARENAYFDLMRKLTKPRCKHKSRVVQPSLNQQCVELPVGQTRCEIRIEYMVAGEHRESALLASCANYD